MKNERRDGGEGSMNPMTTNELRECPYHPWKPPFTYNRDGQWIEDSNGNRVLDMRGWGFLTGKGAMGLPDDDAAKIQDSIGAHVTQLMNTRPAVAEEDKRLKEARVAIANEIQHSDCFACEEFLRGVLAAMSERKEGV